MSTNKKRSNTSASRRRASAERQKARKNVSRNSTISLVIVAVAIVGIFLGRWIVAIGNGYYEAFVEPSATTAAAVRNMQGLMPTEEEKELLLPLEKQWDLFCAARLRDEVTCTADDGAQLHGYLYNEGSDVTAVVVPRFYVDGTADFLPGTILHELTGCNILLTDPRSQGGSEGQYFTFGMTEQSDLAAWMRWADSTLGKQTFILWGEATGANTILLAAANGLLPDSVAFAVAESPYASLRAMATEYIWKWYSVPRSFLYAIEGKLNGSGAGFKLDDIEVASALEGASPTLPVLFLTSEGDTYIQPAWSQDVIDAYTGPKEIITASGSHGTVTAAEQEAVTGALARWAGIYLK